MRKHACVASIVAAIGLLGGASTWAIAQVQETLSLGNNDSVYIDAKSFKIVHGKAKDGAPPNVRELGAQDISSGAIIFRLGDKLYLVDGASVAYAQDMSDRNRVYGQDMGDRNRVYGQDMSDRNRVYGQDMYHRNRVYLNDPEYVQYKLKKAFEDNWTAIDEK